MKYLFSFLLLVRNEEKSIQKLLKKIRTASGNYNTEIIVIDSGSTDKTLEIVKKFSTRADNIRISTIKKEDFNWGTTKNLAVRKARGKYVCFFSAHAIPTNNKFLTYFLEDLETDKKTVAVYGKQIPYDDTPFIQKIEFICQFNRLDRHTNRKGVLVQNINYPFTEYNDKTKMLWYFLFNPFSCYRRSFLLKYPFKKTIAADDLLMGRFIIEKGYTKVYDRRAVVRHSHYYNLLQYYQREKREIEIRSKLIGLRSETNFFCKFFSIIHFQMNFFKKLYYLGVLFIYYLIKFLVVVEIQLFPSKT